MSLDSDAVYGEGVAGEVHALVRLQGGVFSRQQALDLGLTAETVDARLRRGAWRAICRGVYTDRAGDIERLGMLWAAGLPYLCSVRCPVRQAATS